MASERACRSRCRIGWFRGGRGACGQRPSTALHPGNRAADWLKPLGSSLCACQVGPAGKRRVRVSSCWPLDAAQRHCERGAATGGAAEVRLREASQIRSREASRAGRGSASAGERRGWHTNSYINAFEHRHTGREFTFAMGPRLAWAGPLPPPLAATRCTDIADHSTIGGLPSTSPAKHAPQP
jgi:hypothetical protein